MIRPGQSIGQFLEPWSISALIIVIAATYASALISVEPSRWPSLIGIGSLYLASTLGGAWLMERDGRHCAPPRRAVWVAVFVLQIALITESAIVAHGRTVLSSLGTVSLAVLYLPPVGRRLVIVAVAAVMTASMFAFAPDTWVAVQAIIGLSSAVAFVWAFSHMARSRHEARLALADAHARLRAQTATVAQLAAEQERIRIAREIHDSVGHWLSSVHIHLETARATLDADIEQCRRSIDHAASAGRQAFGEVRQAVRTLRSPHTPQEGLVPALQAVTDEIRRCGLTVDLHHSLTGDRWPPEIELALLRVAQEALTNVRRHADASKVVVSLDETAQTIVLVIEDDGRGLRDEVPSTGGQQGLKGIRERVSAMGGHVALRPGTQSGLRLTVEVPRCT